MTAYPQKNLSLIPILVTTNIFIPKPYNLLKLYYLRNTVVCWGFINLQYAWFVIYFKL